MIETGKMVKESDKSPMEHEYAEGDLEEMGNVLLKAKEIMADKSLYEIVMQHLNGKVKKIRSLSDLRKRQREVEMRDNDMIEAYDDED